MAQQVKHKQYRKELSNVVNSKKGENITSSNLNRGVDFSAPISEVIAQTVAQVLCYHSLPSNELQQRHRLRYFGISRTKSRV